MNTHFAVSTGDLGCPFEEKGEAVILTEVWMYET